MHFTKALFAAVLVLAPVTTAIQNIVLATQYLSCSTNKYGDYAMWFSDSPVCKEALTYQGNVVFGRTLCDRPPTTLLGHTGITFTGCGTTNGAWPTGVRDGGNPALTCRSYPPFTPSIDCPGGSCSGTSTFYYYPKYLCS